jgi:hypothetical protein
MAMSDCEKCWNTPCECGWEFRNMTSEQLSDFIVSTLKYKNQEEVGTVLFLIQEKLKSR